MRCGGCYASHGASSSAGSSETVSKCSPTAVIAISRWTARVPREHQAAVVAARAPARGQQAGEPAGVEERQPAQVEDEAPRLERLHPAQLLVERVRVL